MQWRHSPRPSVQAYASIPSFRRRRTYPIQSESNNLHTDPPPCHSPCTQLAQLLPRRACVAKSRGNNPAAPTPAPQLLLGRGAAGGPGVTPKEFWRRGRRGRLEGGVVEAFRPGPNPLGVPRQVPLAAAVAIGAECDRWGGRRAGCAAAAGAPRHETGVRFRSW